jgi:hypothetical protein
MSSFDPSAPVRQIAYRLLTVVAFAGVAGRIATVERVYEPGISRADPAPDLAGIVLPLAASTSSDALTAEAVASTAWQRIDPNAPTRLWPRKRPLPVPTFGSNDRSRWATIRALVDEGTYAIGHRTYDADGKYRDTGIIFEEGWDSLDKVMDPQTKVFYSSKPPLFSTLMAGEYWLLKHLFGLNLTDGRWWVVRIGLLTANALPLAIYLLLLGRILERYGSTDWGRVYVFVAAAFGTFVSTFAVTLNNHTPAACTTLFALYPLLVWRPDDPDGEPPASAFAVSGFFAALTAAFELPAASLLAGLFVGLLVQYPRRTLLCFVPAAAVPVAGFFLTNYLAIGQLKPAYGEFGGPWYEYEGSYWRADSMVVKRGIDWAGTMESRPTYAFHLLLGHHGVFTLTPIWLGSLAGMLWALKGPLRSSGPLRQVTWLALAVTAAVTVFFAAIVSTVNYGGWTSGARWFFWLTPLLLLALLPVADRLGTSRAGRGLSYVLLGVSVFSATFPAWNPWRMPWIYRLMEEFGWKGY